MPSSVADHLYAAPHSSLPLSLPKDAEVLQQPSSYSLLCPSPQIQQALFGKVADLLAKEVSRAGSQLGQFQIFTLLQSEFPVLCSALEPTTYWGLFSLPSFPRTKEILVEHPPLFPLLNLFSSPFSGLSLFLRLSLQYHDSIQNPHCPHLAVSQKKIHTKQQTANTSS